MKKPIPFGKYYLLDRIAVGGMAEVFKAKVMREEGFEKLFAIKRILPSIAEDDEFIKMFIDEAKIAVQLTHANIAQILDLGKVGDAYFIAMEFVNGKDLRSVAEGLRKKGDSLPIPMCCYVMMKVCEGLDYAHNKKDAAGRELNLVHRDVSPQNVLLSFDGEVKLIDFGIAKAANKAAKTQAGILKGKFGYMSPEQVRGLPLDRRSDVFSAGIVLYEVLTGERLFLGESDFSTLEKVRNVEIMPPSTYNRKIPEELEQIVLKALAREVEDRYQTAMELHDDLQSFMYTFGDLVGRKELSAFMKESYPGDYDASTGDVMAADAEKAPERSSRTASTPPPPPRRSAPPPPPRLSKPGGIRGSVPPPPPKARTSTPPPPPPKKTMMGMPAAVPPKPAMSAPPEAPSAASTPPPPAPSAAPPAEAPPAEAAAAPTPAAPPRPATSAPPEAGTPSPSLAGPPSSSPAASPAAPAEPAPAQDKPAAAPAGLDMEWDDDEMETQIYDKLPEDEKMPGIGDQADAPSKGEIAAAAVAAEARQPGASQAAQPQIVVQAPPQKKSSAGIIIFAIIFVGLLIGALIIVFGVMGKKQPPTLVLVPDPDNATVTVDGEKIEGPFPVTLTTLEPGEHDIVASHDEYETKSVTVELEAGGTLTQSLKLVRKGPKGTGFIVETEPLGCDLVINNRKHPEKTPVTISDLKPGSYTLRVEKEGFLPFSTEVQVADGKLETLKKIVLDPRTVTASISAEPEASFVLLKDGKEDQKGTLPKELVLDTEARYTLVVEAENHQKYEKAIEFPRGDNKLSIDVELEPLEEDGGEEAADGGEEGADGGETGSDAGSKGGSTGGSKGGSKGGKGGKGGGSKGGKGGGSKGGGGAGGTTGGGGGGSGFLTVSTQPWTIVYVDKKKVKNTPLKKYKLSAGKHSVTLLNNDFNIRKDYTVIIEAGKETRIIKNLMK